MLYPEVQDRAQAELAEVIGHDRLPTLDDRPRLPYTNALVKEVLRWDPAAPEGELLRSHTMLYRLTAWKGLPHSAKRDDVIANYLIPKGTMIIPNVWCVHSVS
jgi:cytochrome P450